MTAQEIIEEIRRQTPEAARFEQMAEEAAELAQACLKYARVLRGESPTTKTAEEALAAVVMERSDLETCAWVCGVEPDGECLTCKLERWLERLREREAR